MAVKSSAISASATPRATPETRAILTKTPGMPRRLRAAAFVVTMGSALTACVAQNAGQTNNQTGNPNPSEPPVEDQSMAEPLRQPDTAPPQQAAIDPASLVGMTGARITALFGTPVFVRRDPPGEFWRYRGRTCVLELFFYLQGGAQRVDHIETGNTGANPQDRADCVAKLRKPPARS